MRVHHLDHLNISVRDFDETVAWYGRVFDFELVEEDVTDDGVRWGVIRGGEALLCIYEHADRERLDGHERARRGIHGMAHFALRISDDERWQEVVKEEELEVHYGGAIHWAHSRSWYISDPTGYEIEVVCWDADTISFENVPAYVPPY